MYLKELKCIEILINQLLHNQDVEEQINNNFSNGSDFSQTKTSLFNILTINTLLRHYTSEPSFSLEEFINSGTISNKYLDRIKTPVLDVRYMNDPENFIFKITEALRNSNYVFDDEHNIIISSMDIETKVSEEWLYRLSQGYKTFKQQHLYLQNKNITSIKNPEALKKYLYSSKTFLHTCNESNNEFARISYEQIEAYISSKYANSKQLKIDTIIKEFNNKFATLHKKNEFNLQQSSIKFQLPNVNIVLSKAEKMGKDFYRLPFEKQKEYINIWILEYLNTNDRCEEETQKYLLLLSEKNGYHINLTQEQKERILVGLFALYITIFIELNIDYTNISLSSFKISNYLSQNLQNNLIELNNTISELDLINIQLKTMSKKIETLWQDIDKTNEQLVNQRQDEIKQITYFRDKLSSEGEERLAKRNSLQNLIKYQQTNSLPDIAFDNDEIIKQIFFATKKGRIYIDPLNPKKIVIENNNDILGKNTFNAEIKIEEMAAFISVNNYMINQTPLYFK